MKLVLTTAVLVGAFAPVVSLSYLDSLSKNPVVSAPSGGSNGASYLDAISGQGAPAASAPSGSGMSSYLDSLPSGDSAAPWGVSPEPVAEEPAPTYDAPEFVVSTGTDISGSGIKGYLDSIASSTSTAPTGSGLGGYLSSLPQGPAPTGYGLKGYLDSFPSGPGAPTGAGIKSFADSLSPSTPAAFSSYAPSASQSAPSASAYTTSYSASGGEIGFTLEADNLSELVKQMGSSGSIRLSGTVENVAFN